LEAEVRKQAARVEKVGRTLLDVGASDYLKAALKQWDDKLPPCARSSRLRSSGSLIPR
jgi:hypothetical protein